MSAQHPTPWRAEGRDNGKRGRLRREYWSILDRNDFFVAEGLDETTAREIVAAVNARAALGEGETPTGKGVEVMDKPNTLPGFDAVLDAPAPDPRNTVLVFPLDADGEPTEEALRQFAAIINAADQAEKERTQ